MMASEEETGDGRDLTPAEEIQMDQLQEVFSSSVLALRLLDITN